MGDPNAKSRQKIISTNPRGYEAVNPRLSQEEGRIEKKEGASGANSTLASQRRAFLRKARKAGAPSVNLEN